MLARLPYVTAGVLLAAFLGGARLAVRA